MNVMAVVDHLKRFMFIDIKPGSNSDKKMFKESNFGRTIKQRIPVETHFLADAGYILLDYVLIPFPIRSENSKNKETTIIKDPNGCENGIWSLEEQMESVIYSIRWRN